jgi:hypothetical protein
MGRDPFDTHRGDGQSIPTARTAHAFQAALFLRSGNILSRPNTATGSTAKAHGCTFDDGFRSLD